MLLGDGYPELKRARLGKRGLRQFTPDLEIVGRIVPAMRAVFLEILASERSRSSGPSSISKFFSPTLARADLSNQRSGRPAIALYQPALQSVNAPIHIVRLKNGVLEEAQESMGIKVVGNGPVGRILVSD